MHIKKILEHVLFVTGTLLTCLIILATSDLQAQTLFSEKFGLTLSTAKTQAPSLSLCRDPELGARSGLTVVENMLQGPQLVARACNDNPDINSCIKPEEPAPQEIMVPAFEQFLADAQFGGSQAKSRVFFTAAL